MSMLSLCATQSGLVEAGTGQAPDAALAARLVGLDPAKPVVVMVHGKGYAPGVPGFDPHQLILAARAGHADSRHVSWPRRLGFALPAPRQPRGLGIGFGWHSAGSLWRATAAADAAALRLARLVQMIRRADPHRRIDMIGHSLGARVILGAVPLLATGALGRVILLNAADVRGHAEAALASPGASGGEFFNITTRENDLYDFLFERALAPWRPARDPELQGLGRGVPGRVGWLDVQIDHPATRASLTALGLPLAETRARVCHWSVYLRPGTFRLYRALIHDRARLTLPVLRAALDHAPQPRWQRLWAPQPA